jgi:hypothetical protein
MLAAMLRVVPLLSLLFLASCGSGNGEPSGSSVTVKLPPPEQAAAPGFSRPVAARD